MMVVLKAWRKMNTGKRMGLGGRLHKGLEGNVQRRTNKGGRFMAEVELRLWFRSEK